MQTGEIWYVSLDPTVDDELRNTRPVVILNPGHDRHLRLAVVVPLTAWRAGWEGNPFFVRLEPSTANGLRKTSAADCFQIRAISHSRFLERIGVLNTRARSRILAAIALILDMEPEHCEFLPDE